MTIQYDLTKDDYISFNMHHIKNSKTLKRSLYIQQYVLSLIYIIIPFILIEVTTIPLIFWLIPFIVIYILWIALYPRYFKGYIKRNIEKMLDEGDNKSIFGPVSLSLEESGIIETTKAGESKANWSSIERIEENKDYIFIYINSVSASIIPVRAFGDIEEKNEFLMTLKRYRNDLEHIQCFK